MIGWICCSQLNLRFNWPQQSGPIWPTLLPTASDKVGQLNIWFNWPTLFPQYLRLVSCTVVFLNTWQPSCGSQYLQALGRFFITLSLYLDNNLLVNFITSLIGSMVTRCIEMEYRFTTVLVRSLCYGFVLRRHYYKVIGMDIFMTES